VLIKSATTWALSDLRESAFSGGSLIKAFYLSLDHAQGVAGSAL
jgi:hypothetical protein